ncbi:uncharacterized protein LOC116307674 [Actinia tenebrosa]|uniref:Uncharacterized protein LOC116307674 n=1 Tax=Actinia tenebrosa TaxID=6105 RepID=A0A6P8J7L1_ACTTE|nr:uncharacterized protein LOC116307674 [Actinia tenebrosa]
METKRFWIIVREDKIVSDIKEVTIPAKREIFNYSDDRRLLLKSLCAQLGISYKDDKVLKLRNGRSSLVPISRSLSPNTVTSPFILEVCETHKTVKPGLKQIVIPSHSEICQKKKETLSKRIERLEKIIPDLPLLRKAKLANEMKDVEARLSFLNERMKEAETQQWKGMFKKHPLW